jgi:hypothetical protein
MTAKGELDMTLEFLCLIIKSVEVEALMQTEFTKFTGQ